jgi:transcriptional regulator with GAF, ATPase, and Fis domain
VSDAPQLRLLDVLERRADELVSLTGADACVLSRVVGDVLIVLTQATADGRRLSFGQGFLVSDFPATEAVLRTGDVCMLTLGGDDADPAEAALLRELGFASLLMLPLDLHGERFGLCELYRREPAPFDAATARAALARLRIG